MNRELKFRVWDTENKRFLQHGSFCLFPDDNVVWEVRLLKYYGELEYIPHAVVQQFIGMLDKNGKKIYEGDIVRAYFFDCYKNWTWRSGIVSFDGVMGMYSVYDNLNEILNKSIGAAIICDGEEVIGNIFQNPELLS